MEGQRKLQKAFNFQDMVNASLLSSDTSSINIKLRSDRGDSNIASDVISNKFNLDKYIEQLCNIAGKRDKYMYGVSIFDTNGKKRMPSKYQLKYMSACYLLFNWEVVNSACIQSHIEEIPNLAFPFDQIIVQNNKLKINRQNCSLIYNISTGSMTVQKKIYEANFYSSGQYTKSLTSATFELLNSFKCHQLIRQIQKQGNITAIRTDNFIYFFCGNGLSKQYKLKCYDIKWHDQKLYIFCADGYIRFIHKESALWQIKGDGVGLEKTPRDKWEQGEFMIRGLKNIIIAKIQRGSIFVRYFETEPQIILWKIEKDEEILFYDGCFMSKKLHIFLIIKEGKSYNCKEFQMSLLDS